MLQLKMSVVSNCRKWGAGGFRVALEWMRYCPTFYTVLKLIRGLGRIVDKLQARAQIGQFAEMWNTQPQNVRSAASPTVFRKPISFNHSFPKSPVVPAQ